TTAGSILEEARARDVALRADRLERPSPAEILASIHEVRGAEVERGRRRADEDLRASVAVDVGNEGDARSGFAAPRPEEDRIARLRAERTRADLGAADEKQGEAVRRAFTRIGVRSADQRIGNAIARSIETARDRFAKAPTRESETHAPVARWLIVRKLDRSPRTSAAE